MASYDVAVWLRSENVWPEIVVVVHAKTPLDAAWKVLHTRGVRRATKVALSCGDGTIQRWNGVIKLIDGLAYDQMTRLPMGALESKPGAAWKREDESDAARTVHH